MIITKEIRNKTILDFPTPLPSEQVKHFQNHFALTVLRYVDPFLYNEFIVADAPDLQCTAKMIGVEVTTATLECDAAISGDFATYRQTDSEARKQSLEKKITKRGGRMDAYGISYPPKTSSVEYQTIRDAITRKEAKLSQYKDNGFQRLNLFIHYEEPLCPWTETQMRNLFEETRCSQTYDVVYLCASSVLITYQYSNRDYHVIPISRGDYECFGSIARLTLEGNLNIDSPVWTTCEEK